MHTRLAVGRVMVYKSTVGGLDKTGGPFSYHTSLEPGYSISLFATVQSIGPRINTCSVSPSRGLFLTFRGETYFIF